MIPEHLPGEPPSTHPSAPVFAVRLALRALLIALLTIATAPLWPLFLIGVIVWGWPPNVPRPAQVWRYLRLVATTRPPPPGLPHLPRLWLGLSVLRKLAVTPLWGLAWFLDELLYGRALRDIAVSAPLIEISAARSGSTQLARYLEEDPRLVAPALLQFFFPYLWLWRLAPRTLGRIFTPEWVRRKMTEMMPPEFLERHEGDPFRTDTFDGALYVCHLNNLSPFLGPGPFVEDFAFGRSAPHNRRLWEEDFVKLLDGVARKTLLEAGPGPDGQPRRFFVKGHFLCAAPALARRYPDARFLTIVRDPSARLQSAINFLRSNPVDPTMGPIPWAWLGQALAETEAAYGEVEQRWFTQAEGPRRCVLRFQDYVRDLEGSMARIYRECLDEGSVPPHIPRVHPPRERTHYRLNRSPALAGVDEAAFAARVAPYAAWCSGEDEPRR